MLVELHIQNIALIESLTLSFGPGLTVFTGETGAGKSLLIDAVQAVLGGRVLSDLIRTGSDRAVVEAVFDITNVPAAAALLAEWDLAEDGEPTVIVTRELSRHGRHAARVNRRPVSASALRELTAHLVDLCGQHEHQSLLQADAPRQLLDSYGGEPVLSARRAYATVWDELQAVRQRLAALQGGADHLRQLDLLRFQCDEIDAAQLRPGEDAELAQQRELLQSGERRRQLALQAYTALYDGSDTAPAAADLAGEALAALEELAALDDGLAETVGSVRLAIDELQAAGRQLRTYAETIDSDPEQLEAVLSRLDVIANLRRKYGDSIESVLAYREQAAAELADIENAEERRAELTARIEMLTAELTAKAAVLTAARQRVAQTLGTSATDVVRRLGMPNAQITFAVEPAAPGPTGADDVQLLFSANPGEPPRPVARVASGGELSRLTLALRTVTAGAGSVGTLIFDEVDGGISGQAAQAVAEEMAALAADRQVFAVTHLVQMAAMADQHLHIAKAVADGRTFTEVLSLDTAEQRADELARLVGGSSVTAVTRQHAMELLTTSAERKQVLRQQAKVS